MANEVIDIDLELVENLIIRVDRSVILIMWLKLNSCSCFMEWKYKMIKHPLNF